MQKALKHSIHFLISASLFFACTKENKIPNEVVSNDPVFSIEGTIDGKTVNMIAGEASFYMYTFILQDKHVNYYSGNLSNGEDEFNIKLAEGDLDIPESNQGISAQSVMIAPNNAGPLAVLNRNLFNNTSEINELEWIINGNNQIGEEVSIVKPGKYNICAEITFSNGNTGTVCNTYLIGYERNGNATINFSVDSNQDVIAIINNTGASISEVKWFRNGTFVSSDLEYVDSNSQMERYALKAQISFDNGAIMEREVWVDRVHPENYIEDVGMIEKQSSLIWDYKAQIELMLDGKKYIALDDSNTATFEITEAKYFAENANGNNVIKITGNLNIPFLRTSDQEFVNGNFIITFGVANN